MNAEHTYLKARFAAPAERDLPPGRHDLHREILMNHMLTQPSARKTTRHGGSRSGRPPGRVLAAAAAVALVGAGATGYAISAAHPPAARPPVANRPTTSPVHPGQAGQQAVLAAKVLRAAAAHVARESVTSEPSPGQWIYYRTVGYGYPGVSGPPGVTTDEEWVTFDGSQTAYYQNGQIVTHTSPVPPPGPGVNRWDAWNTDAMPARAWVAGSGDAGQASPLGGGPKTAYDVLASLPTNPQALLKVIANQAAGQNAQNIAAGNPIAGGAPKTEAQREFDYLTLILWNAAVVGGPPAAEAAAYQAMAALSGITVQPGIEDTAGGQAIGVSDDGGYDQLLIDPVSYQVIGIRQFSTGIGPTNILQEIASGRVSPQVRKLLAGLTKAERDQLIAKAKKQKKQHWPPYPPKGTLIDEIVYARTAEVPAPGDR
jgi:hypothetical protein